MDKLIPGDIIQILPQAEVAPCWRSSLMIVEKVDERGGVLAFVIAPRIGEKQKPPGRFYLNVKKINYVRCGQALYIDIDIYKNLPAEEKFKFFATDK
jgi:hypothetical protein